MSRVGPIVWSVRSFELAILITASVAAQSPGSLARQLAAAARQREGSQQSSQRQEAAAARQRAAADRLTHDEPWTTAAAEPGAWAGPGGDPACRSLEAEEARTHFQAGEQQNGLPAGLLEAVARQESGLYPCAVSRAGAVGLMQLMPATAAEFGVANPLDPWQSLQAGGQFLKLLLDHYGGDLTLALGAYNAGPSRVDSYGGIPPIVETQNYVESVLTRMQKISAAESQPKP